MLDNIQTVIDGIDDPAFVNTVEDLKLILTKYHQLDKWFINNFQFGFYLAFQKRHGKSFHWGTSTKVFINWIKLYE